MKGKILVLTLLVVAAKAHIIHQNIVLTGEASEPRDLQEHQTDHLDGNSWIYPGNSAANNGLIADAVSSLEQNLLKKLEEMTSNLSATNINPTSEASSDAVSSLEQNMLKKLEEMTSSLSATNKDPTCEASPDAVSSLEQNLLKKLEEMTSSLSATIRNLTSEASRANCGPTFTFVGGLCLFREPSQEMTWSKARMFCQERGADLAVFKDVKAFEAMQLYMKSFDSKSHYWIGGTDLLEEDRWLWIDGDDMPRGSPYWGRTQPGGGTGENCAYLNANGHFLIYDGICSSSYGPLCQYFPSA